MGTNASQPSRRLIDASQTQDSHWEQHILQDYASEHSSPVGRQHESHQASQQRTTQQVVHQPQAQDIEWPIPPRGSGIVFRQTILDSEQYLLADLHIKDPPKRPQPPAPVPGKSSTKVQHNQRDTSDHDWGKKINSQIVDSAHVQSQLTAQFHACYNLASYQTVDTVLSSLKTNRTDFDYRVKYKLAQLFSYVEEKLTVIIEHTKLEQDRLLAYDKARQTEQEQLFQEWLQRYIVKLNEWRSLELAELQKELLDYQKRIIQVSQQRTRSLNEEANRIKLIIIQQEEAFETEQTDKVFTAMYDISRKDAAQHLGSESKTELNLRIQANVGVMAPGQGCTNIPTS